MGTSRVSITGDAVNQHGRSLDQTVADMNSTLQKFITSLESLPAVWKGAAYQSFGQVQERWQDATTDLNRSLTDIKSRVSTAGQIYDAGHAEQREQWRQIDGGANWEGTRSQS